MGSMKRRERYEAEQWAKAQQRIPVMMQFRSAGRFWRVNFRQRGDSVPLPRAFYFGSDDKLKDLFDRFGASRMAEDFASLEFALRTGGGAVELMLGEAQVARLRTHKVPTLNTERGVSPWRDDV